MATVTDEPLEPAYGYTPFARFHAEVLKSPTPLRAAITAACRCDERAMVLWLQAHIHDSSAARAASASLARTLVTIVRTTRSRASGVDALMHEFSLSSEEGVALMCLAEALLRIPDHQTADRLIADQISKGNWYKHLGHSPSLFVNAATWGLSITGTLVGTHSEYGLGSALGRLIARGGEPLIRKGVDLAMRMLGHQFVTGQTIEAALANSREKEARGYCFSYDMLGEGALTGADAALYYAAYENALHAIGRASNGRGIKDGPGISVKLSALHARYARAQRDRVLRELVPRLKKLLLLAKHYEIGLNIDAEEADRLELSLDLLEALALDDDLSGFNGLGFVVQAYQKRAPFVIDHLIDLARRSGRKLMLRLVKGAYWDTEIKRAQVDGLTAYPVFTRKAYTDASYLVCAQKLLAATDCIYPQFATHNAHSLAAIYTWAQERGIADYEFQCLHGMGEALYDQVVGARHLDRRCRIYAPVGSHKTLLPYLVRRLLENGANSSFVNQIVDEDVSIDGLLADPFQTAKIFDGAAHPHIPLPVNLFGAERRNSMGIDFSDEASLRELDGAFQLLSARLWHAVPLLSGVAAARVLPGHAQAILNPADRRDVVGSVVETEASEIDLALAAAAAYAMEWQDMPPSKRSAILLRAADLLELHRFEFIALAIREAGKTLPNAQGEVREAADFLRYYAAQIRDASITQALGIVVCISPWNFPLAIFIGQASAALAAGNVVLAKPADQTPLIAYRAVQLLHEAGIPRAALQFLPGPGATVGAQLTADSRVQGVIFTGSTEVARLIHRTLATRTAREFSDPVFIAETGGQNAMIVDSSALPEQVVQDVMTSAFDSAGQRCSALRVLCLQEEIADKVLTMLYGAMEELIIGNPDQLATDIGPVIDSEARQHLLAHIGRLKVQARNFFQLALPENTTYGTFVAPTVLEIASLSELTQEVFGPVLHVLRYERDALPQLIEAINASGYGLTLGVHSRIADTIDYVTAHAQVGNIYVNRNIIGAVVGVQPFGGEKKSGTGPKAGGPFYLKRLQRDPTSAPEIFRDAKAPAIPANRMSSAFLPLLDWSAAHGHDRVYALGQHYARSTPLSNMLVLSGTTGERNTLSFAPRGHVLCIAAQVPGLLNQLLAVFATGNVATVTRTALSKLPGDFPAAVRKQLHVIAQEQIVACEMQLALMDTAEAPALRQMLAEREGPLIMTVETTEKDAIALWRLLVERALCINTAAAGGNAGLMTLER